MKPLFIQNATEVRRDWSSVMEKAIRSKPQFIKRTRDLMVLADMKLFEDLLSAYKYTAEKFVEEDGSVTLSLSEIDLIENAATEESARLSLGKSVLEYAEDFYNDYSVWSAAPNRKGHVPYVLKALIMDDAEKIGASIECLHGKN